MHLVLQSYLANYVFVAAFAAIVAAATFVQLTTHRTHNGRTLIAGYITNKGPVKFVALPAVVALVALPLKLPVTLPIKFAEIVPALKLPDDHAQQWYLVYLC